jgi:hypothetical protein
MFAVEATAERPLSLQGIEKKFSQSSNFMMYSYKDKKQCFK